MPIYEYLCEQCGGLFEMMLKFSDSQPRKCRQCGGKLKKQISNTTFVLKGTGWYATDYGKNDSGGKKAAAGRNTSGDNGPGTEESPGKKKDSGSEKGKEVGKETEKEARRAPVD